MIKAIHFKNKKLLISGSWFQRVRYHDIIEGSMAAGYQVWYWSRRQS